METNRFEGLINANSKTKRPGNDNRAPALSFGRSSFADDVVARIYKPSRSAMTSGSARSRAWRLVIERRRPQFIEPLMGWTGDDDPVAQVHLAFPTKDAAITYAQRQGLTYVVDEKPAEGSGPAGAREHGKRSFSNITLRRLGLGALEDSYGRAMASSSGSGADGYASAMAIVTDPELTLDEKRSHLMNWAWNEYLADQATNEGMPENDRASRLHEIELALLALERQAESANANRVPSDQAAA